MINPFIFSCSDIGLDHLSEGLKMSRELIKLKLDLSVERFKSCMGNAFLRKEVYSKITDSY